MKAAQQVSACPENMVLLAWVLVLGFFLVAGGLVTTLGIEQGRMVVPYFNLPLAAPLYFSLWLVVLASFSTVLALGLALKPRELPLALALAFPIVLVMGYALVVLVMLGKFEDERPIEASMFFVLCMVIYGPVLIRSVKDETRRCRLYQATLLAMALMSATALLGFTLFRSG